ncbi:hypothetical protein AR457_03475 [Streptomyces agglomeratus]|uniref:Uncharacterized protein n=1 Tax=Streptomyces agglomeratus TaxID=285458 RepID=A0A1E5P2D9_9ACTN|nr:hypothetical protein [Streptomyces agglomeratus]OEJ23696.1 hypothetical protein AS594_03580 [Streptomyces agglomeratus]OEJ43288.1 hypothetical protein AR457_03475 [Streptomyces agglomeratus]OEJ54792.1 hypothetical protein BGK72_32295 [Streptomyces agglomeratus]OEJ62165.1 hypothetical protein BGM19_33200 [Streptomyces agglomeratus]
MARGHRFHLDQDGHSVTVQTGQPSGGVELLVDGKVVGYQHGRVKGVTTLSAELPEDPPRPFRILLEDMGGELFCAMESSGQRFLMPQIPLWKPEEPPPRSRAKPSRPLKRLRRLLRRL